MFLLHCAAAAHAQHCERLLRLAGMAPPGVTDDELLLVGAAFAEAFLTLQLVAGAAVRVR